MLTTIIKNQWIRLFRSPVVVILLFAITVLSTAAIVQSASNFGQTRDSRDLASKHMRDRFLAQGEVNPHSAAHYGHFVYKPLSTLSVLDEGVNPYTGVSLRLEGHRQNEAMFSPAQGSSSLVRFGQFNLSLVLQVIFPLLILFVCHNAISQDREKGILAIAISQGTSVRKLIWGRALAYLMIWAVLLVLLFVLLWVFTAEEGVTRTDLIRLVAEFILYLLYYFIITSLSVYVSARMGNSSKALTLLLFVWLGWTILLPKIMANLGDNISPLASRLELDKRIATDNKNGINGHDPGNIRTKRFRDSLLRSYGVDTVSKLPINLDGLTMQADEEYHNLVYDKHLGDIQKTITAQNKTAAIASLINPFAALSGLSMGLAGTDSYHHFHFTTDAEQYRRQIIRKMNLEQAYGGSRTGDWDWTVKKDFWTKFGDMQYRQPSVKWSLSNYLFELLALVCWILATVILINTTTKQINIR